MRIRLIRHGETDWNKERRMQGRVERPLNIYGLRQAHSCSKYLSKFKIDAIYSSSQLRAVQTAEIISAKSNLEVIKSKEIQEINLGTWEGSTWQQISANNSEIFSLFEQGKDLSKIYKGESWEEVQKRSLNFIYSLREKNQNEILIVTHSGVIKCLICAVLNLGISERNNFEIANLSISSIKYLRESSKWKLESLNENNYLKLDLDWY